MSSHSLYPELTVDAVQIERYRGGILEWFVPKERLKISLVVKEGEEEIPFGSFADLLFQHLQSSIPPELIQLFLPPPPAGDEPLVNLRGGLQDSSTQGRLRTISLEMIGSLEMVESGHSGEGKEREEIWYRRVTDFLDTNLAGRIRFKSASEISPTLSSISDEFDPVMLCQSVGVTLRRLTIAVERFNSLRFGAIFGAQPFVVGSLWCEVLPRSVQVRMEYQKPTPLERGFLDALTAVLNDFGSCTDLKGRVEEVQSRGQI